MWRIQRRLLIPAISVLLVAGLLVPAEAAPPKPVVWTITQQGSTPSAKVVTLKAVIPVDPKDAPVWFWVNTDLGNCTETGCTTSSPNSTGFLGLIYAGQPTEPATGTGWTVTGEYSKAGLTITIKLDGLFFPSTPPDAEQYIHVSLHALYTSGDVFYVESKIQQAFWWETSLPAPDSNQK